MKTTVHVLRHGEVHNPTGVLKPAAASLDQTGWPNSPSASANATRTAGESHRERAAPPDVATWAAVVGRNEAKS